MLNAGSGNERDIAINTKPIVSDSDEDVLQKANQGAEIISIFAETEGFCGNSVDSAATDVQMSAPADLAMLEATCRLTQPSPSLVRADDRPRPPQPGFPFEQARKSLSKSRFGIRVIHNDGDPSDRNLI